MLDKYFKTPRNVFLAQRMMKKNKDMIGTTTPNMDSRQDPNSCGVWYEVEYRDNVGNTPKTFFTMLQDWTVAVNEMIPSGTVKLGYVCKRFKKEYVFTTHGRIQERADVPVLADHAVIYRLTADSFESPATKIVITISVVYIDPKTKKPITYAEVLAYQSGGSIALCGLSLAGATVYSGDGRYQDFNSMKAPYGGFEQYPIAKNIFANVPVNRAMRDADSQNYYGAGLGLQGAPFSEYGGGSAWPESSFQTGDRPVRGDFAGRQNIFANEGKLTGRF